MQSVKVDAKIQESYFRRNINIKNITFFKMLIMITVLKISVSSLSVLIVEYFTSANLWKYTDFLHYIDKDFPSVNFLYSLFIQSISAKDISDPSLVILACILSGLIDTICIYIFVRKFSVTPTTIIMYLAFCFHPYFSFYTFRFDTLFFGKIACVLFISQLFMKDKINLPIVKYSIAILSMFRFTNLLFLLALILEDIRLQRFKFGKTHVLHLLILVFISCIITFLNTRYFSMVTKVASAYSWNLEYIQGLFGSYGVVIDTLTLYALKFLILLGGREAVFTEQFYYFSTTKFQILEYFMLFFLAFFHLICLSFFVRFSKNNNQLIPVLISLSVLILCVFTVGHMRYLISFYPMILIGWLSLGEKFNSKVTLSNNAI